MSIGSLSVEVEQPSEQHVQKMAPQQKKKRSLAKKAPAAEEPQRKRARLDGSSDLVNLLTTSAPVLDIFAASGSRPFPKEAMEVEVTCITKC